MTALPDRPNTAVIVIDVQNGVVARSPNRDAVVANIALTVEKARAAGAPVIWVQHESEQLARDTDPWRIVPELIHDEATPERLAHETVRLLTDRRAYDEMKAALRSVREALGTPGASHRAAETVLAECRS